MREAEEGESELRVELGVMLMSLAFGLGGTRVREEEELASERTDVDEASEPARGWR